MKRLTSRRAKAGSGAAIATLALLGSGLAASTAPAASVEAPQAPTVKQGAMNVNNMKQSNLKKGASADRRRCRIPRCYGAITLAFGDVTAGLANKSRSRRAAFQNARADCRRDSRYPCRRIVWVRNGCAAIAVRTFRGRVHKYGYASPTRNPRPAIRKAKRKCKQIQPRGRPCLKTAYVCTPRRY